MNLIDLTQEIPYKWRVQSYSKTSTFATCVAYIDARDAMNLLDHVVSPENWQSDYKEIKGNLYGGIGIKINNEWIWKWDCGTESQSDKEKGESSDAFKRAAVKWGIGRFLYDIPIQFVKTNDIKKDNNYPYPVDDKGNKLRDLSLHLNKDMKPLKPSPTVQNLINRIHVCNSLDELRVIRSDNTSLELENQQYKEALLNKYNVLSKGV